MTHGPDQAGAVLRFWFDEVGKSRWFAKDPALDAKILARFGPLRAAVLASHARDWRTTPDAMMAAILLLDQFSRNIFRGDARAFAADPLALELAFEALAEGLGERVPPAWRPFLLMPLMHSEDPAVQARSVAAFAALGNADTLAFAERHQAQIARFGRFPGRNAALGRVSSPDELAALAQGAAF